MNNNKMTFIDEQGKEVLCEILFTFRSEEFNKNYVIFFSEEDYQNNEKIEIMAASLEEDENGNAGRLKQIVSEEEWALIKETIQDYLKSQKEDELE